MTRITAKKEDSYIQHDGPTDNNYGPVRDPDLTTRIDHNSF